VRGRRIKVRVIALALLLAGSPLLAGAAYAASFAPAPSISVIAADGMFTFHSARIGFGQFMEALLSVQQVNTLLPVDIYIGVILPDGRSVSWVGDPRAPTFVIRATPVPFLTNVVPTETTVYRLPYVFYG